MCDGEGGEGIGDMIEKAVGLGMLSGNRPLSYSSILYFLPVQFCLAWKKTKIREGDRISICLHFCLQKWVSKYLFEIKV